MNLGFEGNANRNNFSDVMEECLNHMIASRVARIYIRDRREAEQILAFDALGRRLSELVAQAKKS